MEITAAAVQTVNAGQNILFTETAVSSNTYSILHRQGSGLVTLRGLTQQCRALYKVFFSGNIAIPSGGTLNPISLAISINGEPQAAATMIVTPAATGEFFNVSDILMIEVPKCCCAQVGVENAGTTAIETQNANLIVERVA